MFRNYSLTIGVPYTPRAGSTPAIIRALGIVRCHLYPARAMLFVPCGMRIYSSIWEGLAFLQTSNLRAFSWLRNIEEKTNIALQTPKQSERASAHWIYERGEEQLGLNDQSGEPCSQCMALPPRTPARISYTPAQY